MGQSWTVHPSWEIVEDASDVSGRDVAHLLLDAGPDELAETRNAQLGTFTLSLVILDAVERLGIEPTRVAGHSVGEYAALAAGGVIGFEDAVRIVAERSEAMQAAAEAQPGIMAVVLGSDAETVDVACHLADGEVWIANFNSPEETVIAGHPDAVGRAVEIAAGLGARKAVPAPVCGAFHTPLMAPARDRLRKVLATTTFHESDIPVIANVDSRSHTAARDWQLLLLAQLCHPIRWRQSIMRLGGLADPSADTEHLFVELGPGDSLSTMVRHTLPSVATITVATPSDLDLLVDTISGDSTLHNYAIGHQGEQLYVSERVVISPGAGVFEPTEYLDLTTGTSVEVGTLLGTVSGTEILSPFAGVLQGALAHRGERVQTGQPIVWLHSS
jgi:[acyl-carrier-protein] S-malonyltransferase